MTRKTKQNPQPPRYSKNVRQAIEDRILTFPGTRTSHLSQIRSLRSFPVKPGERLDCGFYSISAVHQKSRALRRLESSKLPRDTSSWADVTAKVACKPSRRGTMQLCSGQVCDGHSFWPPTSFRISTILRTGASECITRIKSCHCDCGVSSQGRKDLFSIIAGVAKFAVAVAALVVQPVNLAHQT